jgi:hypothetical protein
LKTNSAIKFLLTKSVLSNPDFIIWGTLNFMTDVTGTISVPENFIRDFSLSTFGGKQN